MAFSAKALLPGGIGFASLFGGGGKSQKTAAHQEDNARQAEEFVGIINQYLGQLVPGSQEYNDLVNFGNKYLQQIESGAIPVSELGGSVLDQQPAANQYGSQLVQQQQGRIAGGGPATALEARTQQQIGNLRGAVAHRPEEEAIFSALRGLPLAGEQAASGTIFADLVSRAQNPDQYYTSTLQPQLDLAESSNRAKFASRGLLRSGLEQEGATRAGNELAIAETAQKEGFRQNQLSNFMNLYGMGQDVRGRDIGLEEAITNIQLGRESNLTGLLANQSFARSNQLADLYGGRSTQASKRFDDLPSLLDQIEQFSRIASNTRNAVSGSPLSKYLDASRGVT